MKIFLNLTKRKLDEQRYSRALDKYLREVHLEGLKAFVNAAYVKVPVYTGQARATFVPLAQLVGTSVIINPRARRKDRSVSTGIQKGIFKLVGDKFKYKLEFNLNDPSLQYFEFLDNNAGRSPSSVPNGWRSLETGRRAYIAKVNELLKSRRLTRPKVSDFLVFTRITLNG